MVISLEVIKGLVPIHLSTLGIISLILTLAIGLFISIHDYEFFSNINDTLGRMEVGFQGFECTARCVLCILEQYTQPIYGVSISLCYSLIKLIYYSKRQVFYNEIIRIVNLFSCITYLLVTFFATLNISKQQNSLNIILLLLILPICYRIGYQVMGKQKSEVVQIFLFDPKIILKTSPNKLNLLLELIFSHQNNFYEEYITRSGVLIENLFTSHIQNCETTQCFCHRFKYKPEININDLLGDQYRKQFLNELIVSLFEGYLENLKEQKNSANEDNILAIQRSYIQFLIIEQLYPPKALSLLYSIIQELHQKNKVHQLFFFNLLQWRAMKTLNSTDLLRKTSQTSATLLQQKPLPIHLPIEFDELFSQFKSKLSNQLLRQKEYINFLCQGYLNLSELELKSKRNLKYIQELINLQKQLIVKNPANEEFQFYSNIFNNQLNFFSIEANCLYKSQLQKRKEDIYTLNQNIDVFSSNSCSVYVSLSDKENQIMKVSNNFTKIFDLEANFILGKSLNMLMVKQMCKIHNEYINKFTQKSCISNLTHTKQRLVYGISGNGFIIPLTVNIKIENTFNSIGLCALVTRDFANEAYNILTTESGKIISISEPLFNRLFKGIFSLSELQEQNIESILETLNDGENQEQDSQYNVHGLIKIKRGKGYRKTSRISNKPQEQDFILFTKYYCLRITTDLYDNNKHINNYEFENFWERLDNNSSVIMTKRNSFHNNPIDGLEVIQQNQKSELLAMQIINSISPRESISLIDIKQQRMSTKRKTIQQHINERKVSMSNSTSRIALQPYYMQKDTNSCVFEEEEDEGQDKLTPRKYSSEYINRISMEKDDLPEEKQQKLLPYKEGVQQQYPYLNNSLQTDTAGCLSPYASKNDLSTRANENDLFSQRIPRIRESSLIIQNTTPKLKLNEQLCLENKSNYQQQESRRYSIAYQNQQNSLEYQINLKDSKSSNSQNSSVKANKEDQIIESLSSKKTEKIENRKRQLVKQITNHSLSALPKLIVLVSILSILILISSSFYFYINDSNTIAKTESIFNKISKSFELALEVFIFSKEKSFTKIIGYDQDLLKIDNTTLNRLVDNSVNWQNQLVNEFLVNVEGLMKSKGEEYFDYMVDTKIKVMSSVKEPNEKDYYRQDTVLYNLVNYISSLNQIITYPTLAMHFPMSVVYGNIIVFEESLVQIQQCILNQSENYFNLILHDQLLQIFMISIGSLIIFILGLPFSLYLQKKKANLLQLLGSYQPKRFEEYINSIQQSLERIRQFEYESYLQRNPNLFSTIRNGKGVENVNNLSQIFRMSSNYIKIDSINGKQQQQSKEKKRRTRQIASFNYYQITTGYHILTGFVTLGLLIILPLISYTIVEKFVEEGKYILQQQQIISKSIQFLTKQEMLNVKMEDLILRNLKPDIFYYTYGITILNQFTDIESDIQSIINHDLKSKLQQDKYIDQMKALTHGNICEAIQNNPKILNNTYTPQDCEKLSQGVFKRGFLLAMSTQLQVYKDLWDLYKKPENDIISFLKLRQTTNQNILDRNKSSKFLLDVFTNIKLNLNNSKELLSDQMIQTLTYLTIFQIILIFVVVALGSWYLQSQFKYGLKQTQKLLTNIPVTISLENDYMLRYFKYK